MTVTEKAWDDYIAKLRKINDSAASAMLRYLARHPNYATTGLQEAIDAAFAVASYYGEAATALACEMYDAMAAASLPVRRSW